MRYVLASGSPRRKELLMRIIPSYEVIPATGEEKSTKTEPSEIVEELSFQKASEIFNKILTDSEDAPVVIGADTVVSYNHKVLGKPSDAGEAEEMIRLIEGGEHSVFTGVTLFFVQNDNVSHVTFSEQTKVYVAPMSDEEIKVYANSPEPLDKAGAYGIQGEFGKFITGIDGDFYNVMGLPVARLYKELKANKLL